ncbi:YfcC family protein [Thermodesulfobacteriota bacterium]
MFNRLKKIEMPHVFTLLTYVIFFCVLLTYIIPSGSYERGEKEISGRTRTVVIPGTYQNVEKEITLKGIAFGDDKEGKASPAGFLDFLTAIPRGLEDSADIIFFIFILGGVFGILNKTGIIIALLQTLMNLFKNAPGLLTFFVMAAVAIGGSTLGMGEEFIPLVPIFVILATRMGYDPIYGLCMVMLAADIGFASATFNPFTVGIASGIAEVTLGGDIFFRISFLVITFTVSFIYVLRYGAIIKKDPSKSLVPNVEPVTHIGMDTKVVIDKRFIAIFISGLIIFGFIIFATVSLGWWFNEMAGGFFLIGLLALIFSKLTIKEASQAFVKGMEEMVVAALVVGFARGIIMVMNDGQILDSFIHSAANMLENFHNVIAVQGMLIFQSTLNFFIPSGSGQAAAGFFIDAHRFGSIQ